MVPAACVPVWVALSRSCASVALAVAFVAMPSSFVFAADAAHHIPHLHLEMFESMQPA
jgi:hypothetical protein